MSQDSQTFGSALYIVATPIGNLKDITLRALEVLRAADLIACEDTRTSRKLLSAYGIKARLTSYHDYSNEAKRQQILEEVCQGRVVALISDAGTPLISDPGYKLVREAVVKGIKVIPVPGASSVLSALSVCGLPTDRFLFNGFLPAKATARNKEIEALVGIDATIVLFESVHRLSDSLTALAHIMGAREAVIAREITKLYEELRRGTLPELAEHYQQAGEPKGEVVIVIAPPAKQIKQEIDSDALLLEALKTMSVKDAARHVAGNTGLARQELYSRALALK